MSARGPRRRRAGARVARSALALSIGAACLAVYAGARAETIAGALAKAYLANSELDEQRANVRVRDEDVPRAAAGMRPHTSISVNGGPQRTIIRQPAGFDSFHHRVFSPDKYSGLPKNGTFSLQQPVFDGWKTTNSVRQAESGVYAARAQLRQSEQETLENAATAYMNVLRDAAVVSLRKNNIAVLKEQLRVTRDRQIFGEVTLTDVAQAETALAQANAEHVAAQGALENSAAVYVRVIGEVPQRLEPAPSLDHRLPAARDDAILAAMTEHPGIVAAQHQVDAAEAAVKVAESQLLPTASVGAQVVQQYDSYLAYPGTRQFSAQILGQLNVPLYQGGGEYAGVRQAKEQLGQARIHAETQRRTVRAGVVQAFSQLAAARASVTFNRVAVKSAETALAGVRNEAAFGQRTTYDVLTAQQQLLKARVDLVTSQRDQIVGGYAVLSAIGRLSAKSLNLDAPSYDPGEHFEQVRDKWFGLSTPTGD